MALPKFEDFKAPWEIDLKEGEEPTFDFEKGKRYLYNVLSDKEKAQTERDEAKQERDALKSEKEAKDREGESEADRLKRELAETQDKLKKAEEKDDEDSPAVLRLKVALEQGLSETQAKRLVGTTKEELEADAKELLESFGGAGDGEDNGGEGPRTRPRRQTRNPGDPQGTGGDTFDPEKEADAYVANSLGF